MVRDVNVVDVEGVLRLGTGSMFVIVLPRLFILRIEDVFVSLVASDGNGGAPYFEISLSFHAYVV